MSLLGDGSYSQHFTELNELRSRYQAILQSTLIGVVFADANGAINSANDRFLNILPRLNLDVDSINLFEDFFEISSKKNNSGIIQSLLSGSLNEYTIELTKTTKRGPFRYQNSLTVCRRDDGSFLNFLVIIEEVPELVGRGKGMRAGQLEEVLHHAPIAIGFLRGEDFIIETANKSLLNIWGKTSAVIGKAILEGLPEIKDQPFPDLLREVLKSGEPFYGNETLAYLNREKPMEEGYYNFIYFPVKDREKTTTGVLVVVSDVSELVRAKNNLSRSEQRFRELIEYADVSIAVYKGRDLVIELANDSMLQLWGKGPEVKGKTLREALPELEGQPFFSQLEHVFDTGEVYRATKDPGDLMIDGKLERFYFNFSYKPMFDVDGNVYAILNMAVDVTANVRAAEKLEESERRSRMIIEAAELGTYELDYGSGALVFSDRLREIFGISPGKVINHQSLIDCLHPDDMQIRANAHTRALETGTFEYVARIIHPSGDIRWLRFTGKVKEAQESNPAHLYGVVMDITAAKQEEIRKNSFVSMASHELKTPLTTIKGYIQLLNLEAKKNGSEFFRTVLGKTENQANKMIKMVSDFLDLSKIETNKFMLRNESFDIVSLVNEILEETRMITGFERFVTEYEYRGRVYADKEKIGQVLTNFLNNAVKYAAQGNVYVKIYQDGDLLTIAVRDEGPGIKPEYRQKVFDRYYRVDNSNNSYVAGFGIGLYICAEIIRMHGGIIGVKGEEGEGSVFYFSLKN